MGLAVGSGVARRSAWAWAWRSARAWARPSARAWAWRLPQVWAWRSAWAWAWRSAWAWARVWARVWARMWVWRSPRASASRSARAWASRSARAWASRWARPWVRAAASRSVSRCLAMGGWAATRLAGGSGVSSRTRQGASRQRPGQRSIDVRGFLVWVHSAASTAEAIALPLRDALHVLDSQARRCSPLVDERPGFGRCDRNAHAGARCTPTDAAAHPLAGSPGCGPAYVRNPRQSRVPKSKRSRVRRVSGTGSC